MKFSNSKVMVLVLSGILFLGMVPSLNLFINGSAGTWTENRTNYFEDGESFFVETDDDMIELSRGLSCQWTGVCESNSEHYGHSITSGDVNGDGYDDVIVGAHQYQGFKGKVYLYYGSSVGLSTTPDWTAIGENSDNYFGYCVSLKGDVNGDGYNDLIVGAFRDNSFTGKAYLYHGSETGFGTFPDWNTTGEATLDVYGHSVSSAGDVNGDGFDEVIIGAHRNDTGRGKAYLYYGSENGLSTTPGWTAIGEGVNYEFGNSVASAGDVNSDGYDDVIIGAKGYSSYKGIVYVYHGSSTGLGFTADWSTTGENNNDRLGYSVSNSGDVNGDGYADVIIGAYGNNENGNNAGKSYVYHGSSKGLKTTVSWTKTGENANDQLGWSVASAGDINGDGYDEVIIGANGYNSNTGKSYVYHGSSTGLSISSIWTAIGENTDDQFGCFVATASDINGDGYDEILIGAEFNDDKGNNAGKAYLYQYLPEIPLEVISKWTQAGEGAYAYFGSSLGSAGDVNGDEYEDVIIGVPGESKSYVYYLYPNGLNASASWIGEGENSNDLFGRRVASAGDVNGDGYDDVIVGADGYNSDTGKAYVYHGSSNGLSENPDWNATGEATGDHFGWSVATVGDANGDGYDDVIIGAYGFSSNLGKVYVYHGSPTGLSTNPDWNDTGEATTNEFGQSVAGAGDVNNDGYDDVIVGAWKIYSSDTSAGKAYVYYGSSTGLSTFPDWTASGTIANDFLGYSVSSAGDVNGDNYDDVIIGAYGNSIAGSFAGKALVYHGSYTGLSSNADWTTFGEGSSNRYGDSVSTAGDVNGDGYDDVIVGASGYNSQTGKAYVYLGTSDGLDTIATWTKTGEDTGDVFGNSVASLGDVNGYGCNDVIIGAKGYDEVGDFGGKAYVFHGPGYMEYGSFESELFSTSGTDELKWLSINWEPTSQPKDTIIKFQVGTSNDGATWEYNGHDGTDDTYYTAINNIIDNTQKGKFWRYNIFFYSDTNGIRTPTIDEVTINYKNYNLPLLEVFSPNGGEDLLKEKYHAITWEAIGDFDSNPINLYYSTDSGTTWSLIASDNGNTGYYNWTVLNIETATGLIKVTCIDIYGNNVSDSSDITFAIDPPPPKATVEDEQKQETNEKDEINGEKIEKTDDTNEELTENTQNSKNQKEGTNISSIIAISEGLIILVILISLIIFKRKTKNNNKEVDKEVKK